MDFFSSLSAAFSSDGMSVSSLVNFCCSPKNARGPLSSVVAAVEVESLASSSSNLLASEGIVVLAQDPPSDRKGLRPTLLT